MKKQSQNASSEAIKKAVLKGVALGVTGLTLLAGFTACNNTTQKPTDNPNPNPPVVDPNNPTNPTDPVEKTITINKIYNDNFSTINFSTSISEAQNALANRVFDNLNPQIANITYNETTKELTFKINYNENNKDKSGTMTFVAPDLFQQIRGKGAKTIILEYAQLVATNEVKETSINEIKAKIEKAIDDIEEQIAIGFANVKTSSIIVEKEHDPIPVDTISFNELIADELGDYLGNTALLQETSKTALQQNLPDKTIYDNFKIAIENDSLIFYFDYLANAKEKRLGSATYKGNSSEFEDLINISINPVVLLNKYFSTTLQNKTDIEIGSSEYNSIVSTCASIITATNDQIEKLSALNYKNFTRDGLATHNNELSQEEALQFALKLGYAEDEVLNVYVGTSPNGNIFDDEKIFNTGYMNWFKLSVLTLKNGVYQLNDQSIYVPHYSDSTQNDYYRYFLEGEQGTKYIIKNESSSTINGVIVDFATATTTAQTQYAKVASNDEFDFYLPQELISEYLPR